MRQAVAVVGGWGDQEDPLNHRSPLAVALGGDCRWAERRGDQLGDCSHPGEGQGWLESGWWYWIGDRWLKATFILKWINKMNCCIGRRPGRKGRSQGWLQDFGLNKWRDGMARCWDEEDWKIENSILLFAFEMFILHARGDVEKPLWFMNLAFEGVFCSKYA